MPVDFLAIGHITHDLTADGFRLGGTVTFAAATARRLGRQPAILTRATPEGLLLDRSDGSARGIPGSQLEGVAVCLLPSDVSTTFVNVYQDGQRTQSITAVADPVTPEWLPSGWEKAAIVLLGPIARETPPDWASFFPRALFGMTPQGMMRRWDSRGHVYPGPWKDADPYLARMDAIVLSREDVGGDESYVDQLANRTRLLVLTDGYHGAVIYARGEARRVPPRPAQEVDPTGAGDVFATAFLIRLAETGDPFVAARFANVVASMSVEASGIDAIPYRAQVDEWLARESVLGEL